MNPLPAPLILLVEDNADDCELARAALAQSGLPHRLTVLRDGAEAAHWIEQCRTDDLPRLILLDLKLPKLDGVEVLRRIRDHRLLRYLPVVVLTTSRRHEDLERAYAARANSYIVKPIDFDRFVSALATLCRYWLDLNEPPT